MITDSVLKERPDYRKVLVDSITQLGRQAIQTAALLDPSLEQEDFTNHRPPRPDDDEPPHAGAARDLSDYLGLHRTPPGTNRHGAPHPARFDLQYATGLIEDLSHAAAAARATMDHDTAHRLSHALLHMAVQATLIKNHPKGTTPSPDRTVEGIPHQVDR